MAKKGKDYFGLSKIVSIILCFFLGPILGIIARFSEGKIVAGLLRLFFGWNILWLIDFILIIVKGSILRVINC
ncbi:MAG: hypothetical protein MJ162_05425 [Treponema sp.]|nr:hypothetical protein [Treponema sp.]